jgi:hypothetical protein
MKNLKNRPLKISFCSVKNAREKCDTFKSRSGSQKILMVVLATDQELKQEENQVLLTKESQTIKIHYPISEQNFISDDFDKNTLKRNLLEQRHGKKQYQILSLVENYLEENQEISEVLFVCRYGLIRSHDMAELLKAHYNHPSGELIKSKASKVQPEIKIKSKL